jgi:hypothetical protein
MPTPQAPPAGERHIADLPPLRDNDRPEQDEGSEGHHRGLLSRRTLMLALVVPLFVAATAGGYLYWNYSRHLPINRRRLYRGAVVFHGAEGLRLYHRRAGDG